jgi:hypothetical protein
MIAVAMKSAAIFFIFDLTSLKVRQPWDGHGPPITWELSDLSRNVFTLAPEIISG